MIIFQNYRAEMARVPKGVLLLLVSYCLIIFGSPMPPRVTWVEIAMGIGLLLGGIILICPILREAYKQSLSRMSLVLMSLLFIAPSIIGLVHKHELAYIARDIFPLAFLLFIPILFLFSANSTNLAALRKLTVSALVLVGVFAAITFFVGTINEAGSTEQMFKMVRGGFGMLEATQAAQETQKQESEMLEHLNRIRTYFLKLYDPSMIFAAIFLCSWGIVFMARSWSTWLLGAVLAATGAFFAYGFMILGLRAYTVFFVLAITTICLLLRKDRGLYVRFMPFFLLACAALATQIYPLFHLLWVKQQMVGFNGKTEEWLAVLAALRADPWALFFGTGWGAILENPILLGLPTRFTHSLLSFYLLKTGIVGLVTLFAILVALWVRARQISDFQPRSISRTIIIVSCVPPLLIGVLFEPSYKMLSFGFILALFILSLASTKNESRIV